MQKKRVLHTYRLNSYIYYIFIFTKKQLFEVGMADKLVEILQRFISNENILTLLISAFPLIELKGAIPIGLKLGLSIWKSALLGYFGSTLVSIPLFFLLIPIFNLLKKIPFLKKLIVKIENVFYEKSRKLAEDAYKKKGLGESLSEEEAVKQSRKILRNALLIFVAVPFPVTGIWTGTAIGVFLGLSFKETFPAIVIGNLIAGTIITLLSAFLSAYVDIIIYVLFAIAIVMLIVLIVKIALAPNTEKNN